jgi:hypothetical protein
MLNLKTDYSAAGDGTTNDTAELQDAIDDCISTGEELYIPPGTYLITDQIDISEARGIRVFGAGMGHPTAGTGSILKYAGYSNQTFIEMAGVNSCRFESLCIDGGQTGDARGGIVAVHIKDGTNVRSHTNVFDHVCISRAAKGVRIGDGSSGQVNMDLFSWRDCWIRDCVVGVSFENDQAIQHRFYGCHFLNCAKYDESGAAIRTGSDTNGSGGFQVYGGVFLGCDIDFDIPRITSPILLEGVHSENAIHWLKSSSATGHSGRSITMIGCWQNSISLDSSAPWSVYVDTNNGFQAIGCHFCAPVKVGRQSVMETPYHGGSAEYAPDLSRAFIGCAVEVYDGDRVIEDSATYDYDATRLWDRNP